MLPFYYLKVFKIPNVVCDAWNRWSQSSSGTIQIKVRKYIELACLNKGDSGLGFRSPSEFNWDMLVKQVWNCPSYTWISMMWSKQFLKACLRWRIGNGSSVFIYDDPWIPFPSNLVLFFQENYIMMLVFATCFMDLGWDVVKKKKIFLDFEAD